MSKIFNYIFKYWKYDIDIKAVCSNFKKKTAELIPYPHSSLILKEVIRIYFNLTTDASIHHYNFISYCSDGLICRCPHTYLCLCCVPCSDGLHLLSSEIIQSSIHFTFQPVWSMSAYSTGSSLNISPCQRSSF